MKLTRKCSILQYFKGVGGPGSKSTSFLLSGSFYGMQISICLAKWHPSVYRYVIIRDFRHILGKYKGNIQVFLNVQKFFIFCLDRYRTWNLEFGKNIGLAPLKLILQIRSVLDVEQQIRKPIKLSNTYMSLNKWDFF